MMMEDKELQQSFAFHLHRIKCAIFRVLNKKLLNMNLPVQMEQIPILMCLSTYGDLSQQEIANATERDKSSVQRTVRCLQYKQFVEIQQDQFDRRKNIVHITAAGKAITTKIMKVLMETEVEVFSAFSSRQKTDFLDAIRSISNNICSSDKVASGVDG